MHRRVTRYGHAKSNGYLIDILKGQKGYLQVGDPLACEDASITLLINVPCDIEKVAAVPVLLDLISIANHASPPLMDRGGGLTLRDGGCVTRLGRNYLGRN